MENNLKPILRGHFHQAAFFAAIGACLMLISNAQTPIKIIAAIIYSISLIGLFGISALYHRPMWKPEYRKLMQKFDHAAIYILIAGTGTPINLLAMESSIGIQVLKIVWSVAFIGVLQSLFWAHAPKWLSAILYIIVGCIILPYIKEFYHAIGTYHLSLLLVGGIFYIAGAIIYALKKPNPIPKYFGHHEIFHIFVIIAAIFHFIVIKNLIAL